VGGGDSAAGGADREIVADRAERPKQRLKGRLALLHQVQDRAPRRARPEPGKPRQRLGERLDLLRCHASPLSLRAQRSNPAHNLDCFVASLLAMTLLMRIAFMGTPDFAVPTLDLLIEAGHDIAAVYTQPPRPAGRGKALRLRPSRNGRRKRGSTSA